MRVQVSDAIAAAQALGRQIIVVEVRSVADFDAAFTTVVRRGAGGLIVSSAPFFTSNRGNLVALVASHAIPHCRQLDWAHCVRLGH